MSDAGWTPQRLNDSIQKGNIHPLYYLYGDETFLIDETLRVLEQTVLGEGLRDFNLNIFYGADLEPAQVRDAIETLPMMAPVRAVVIKDAQEMSEKDWEQLMPIIDEPVSTTALICIATRIDKRKKYIKRITEKGVLVEFRRPFENQIPEWIQIIAKKHGFKIASDAVSLVQQLVGSNLQDINAELMKLGQYLGGKKQASVDDVMQVVSHVRLDSIFDLTDAIGRNDRARALYCLANLLDNGQSEVGVLSLISRHVRILKLINDGMKEGLSGQRLSSRAGVSPYFIKSYIEQARYWSERKIDHTFQALIDTDRALKSSPIASHIWLENFIVQTCS